MKLFEVWSRFWSAFFEGMDRLTSHLIEMKLRYDTRGGVANRVIAIIIGVMIVGAIGGTAFAFGVANFSSADSSVATVLGVFVPIIAAIAIALAFLGRRA